MGHLSGCGRTSQIRAAIQNHWRFLLFARMFRLGGVERPAGIPNGAQAKRTSHEHQDDEECDGTRRWRRTHCWCGRDRHGKPVVGYAGSVRYGRSENSSGVEPGNRCPLLPSPLLPSSLLRSRLLPSWLLWPSLLRWWLWLPLRGLPLCLCLSLLLSLFLFLSFFFRLRLGLVKASPS